MADQVVARANAALAAAGLTAGDVDCGGNAELAAAGVADALDGARPLTSLMVALIAEAARVTAHHLLTGDRPAVTVHACRMPAHAG